MTSDGLSSAQWLSTGETEWFCVGGPLGDNSISSRALIRLLVYIIVYSSLNILGSFYKKKKKKLK